MYKYCLIAMQMFLTVLEMCLECGPCDGFWALWCVTKSDQTEQDRMSAVVTNGCVKFVNYSFEE